MPAPHKTPRHPGRDVPMLTRLAKRAIRRTTAMFGYELRRIAPPAHSDAPSPAAPLPFASHPPHPTVHGLDSMEGCLRFLRQRGIKPRCVLDVGANETRWARLAAQVFPESRMVLIEP